MNKYVQNKHIALIRCRVKSTGQQFDFYPERKDKFTGQTEHTGYTEVSDKDLKELEKHSKVFTHSVGRSHLLVTDEIPLTAQAPSQVITYLRSQVALLEAENTSLKEELAKNEKNSKPSKAKEKEVAPDTEGNKDFE